MKRLTNLALGLAAAGITLALVGALIGGRQAAHPHGAVSTAASAAVVVAVVPSPTPPTPSPASAPAAKPPAKAAPAAPVVNDPAPPPPPVTLQSPLPSPSPTPVAAPPPPPPPPPASPPPPPPPVCSWSVTVSTIADSQGNWGTLGTWTGSAPNPGSFASPIFITSQYSWLQYSYQFTDACVGHTTLVSTYTLSGAIIYSDPIAASTPGLRQANVPNNTQVTLTVTVQ